MKGVVAGKPRLGILNKNVYLTLIFYIWPNQVDRAIEDW